MTALFVTKHTVWKSERAMQCGECRGCPIGRALCSSCRPSSGVYIATGAVETQYTYTHTHTRTHITYTHTYKRKHTNYPRGVEGDGVLSCALGQVFSHELGFREDITLAGELLLPFSSSPLFRRHGMGPRSGSCTLFWTVRRWYQATTTK